MDTEANHFQVAGGVMENRHGTERNSAPLLLPVKVENIPDELKALHWGVWRAVPRDDGKIGKPPCNPVTGRMIGADKPELWGTFEDAVTTYSAGDWSGIGTLMEADTGIVGIDLDDIQSIAAKGTPLRKLLKRAQGAGIYIEKSPSGKGARMFVLGKLPGNRGRRKGGIELYSDSRFLTVTGHGAGAVIDGQWLVDELLALIGGETPPAVHVSAQKEADPPIVESLSAWATENHSRLWDGRWSEPPSDLGGIEYPSQSEADMALCGHVGREAVKRGITEAGNLAATVLAVFKQSALYRPEKHRQVEQYAIPKAVHAALEHIKPVAGNAPATDFATAEPGDITAGRLFATVHREKLLYVSQAGRWLEWVETRWVWCACGEEMVAAKKIATATMQWAARLYAEDGDKHKRRMAFAVRLQNLPRLEAMVELAKSEPGMAVGHMSELDANPWQLGVRNGVLNLKDGCLLAPDPAMKITRQVAAEYHPQAMCPRWLNFLNQVFDGDADTIGFIQRALGYTLTGETAEEVLFICYGSGANGKSVFANVLTTIFADYGQMAPPSLLTVRRDGDAGPRNDVARMCGARLAQINELNQGDRLDEQVVKMLAGREMLSARFLHKEYFDFWPTAKPWLRTNHRPVITGEDDGIWRRIMLIPFKRKFEEHERDPWLETRLLNERDGILAWMVQGALDWQRGGLKPSQLVRKESVTYRKESDLLGEFLEEKTEAGPNERIEQSMLFSTWRRWADENGVRYGSKASFTRKLSERGFTENRSNGQRYYAGLKLRT